MSDEIIYLKPSIAEDRTVTIKVVIKALVPEDDLRAEINQEREERIVSDSALQSAIDQEAQTRADAIEAEIQARNDAIEQEAQTRAEAIAEINALIPESASETNKLADVEFVIDKIQENSAHFRGNWATYSAIPTNPDLYPVDDDGNHKPTIHDYLIVMVDETQGGGTWRYTYIGNWDTLGKSGWRAEYEIKDIPFTDRQWNAINSGATQEKIEQIEDNATNIENLTDRTTQAESDIQTLNSSKLEVTNIKAGNNITLDVDGNDITINSTGGGTGASSFSELSGSPYDNNALATALNEKASEEDLQAVNDDIAQIQTDLAGKAEVSALNQTNANLEALTGDVENVSGEVTAHATAIQNLEADKADKETTYTKLETNNLLDAKANQNDLDTVESIAKGAQQGVSFTNYQNAVQNINSYAYDKYNVGQSVYIVTREVPDLWVSAKYETSVPYVYTTDDAIVEALKTTGVIRFGRYQLSPLETSKVDIANMVTTDTAQTITGAKDFSNIKKNGVDLITTNDLSDYVKNTDYATTANVGVVKVSGRGLSMLTGGQITITPATTAQIDNKAQLYNPITPTTLDYSVKVSVTTNTIELTEQEQTSARTWIGATKITVIDDD